MSYPMFCSEMIQIMLKTLMIFWDQWSQVEGIFRALVKEDPREMK